MLLQGGEQRISPALHVALLHFNWGPESRSRFAYFPNFGAQGLQQPTTQIRMIVIMIHQSFFGYWFTFTPPDRGAGGGV